MHRVLVSAHSRFARSRQTFRTEAFLAQLWRGNRCSWRESNSKETAYGFLANRTGKPGHPVDVEITSSLAGHVLPLAQQRGARGAERAEPSIVSRQIDVNEALRVRHR